MNIHLIERLGDFKGKIGDALKKIQASPYTREAIIAGLSAVPIPFVGTYLSRIYQHAVRTDEDKNKEIIKLLENIQKMRDTDLDFFFRFCCRNQRANGERWE